MRIAGHLESALPNAPAVLTSVSLIMSTHLAVIGHRSSHPVMMAGDSPVDLADLALPSSLDHPMAARLLNAIDDALREMRVRQSQFPAGATSELRLGIIVTATNRTNTDVLTASVNLRDLDLADTDDRQTVLDEVQALEREFLSGD